MVLLCRGPVQGVGGGVSLLWALIEVEVDCCTTSTTRV